MHGSFRDPASPLSESVFRRSLSHDRTGFRVTFKYSWAEDQVLTPSQMMFQEQLGLLGAEILH
jgi:hypothetical protein